jgi:methyl coenzyme M reductase gamma subunit
MIAKPDIGLRGAGVKNHEIRLDNSTPNFDYVVQ